MMPKQGFIFNKSKNNIISCFLYTLLLMFSKRLMKVRLHEIIVKRFP